MLWPISVVGKIVAQLSRRLGGGHGSALPGLVIEKLYPRFLSKLLSQLPCGVVLVTGTNGKTTTTKIIADLLQADGYRVFTNTSGSNYVRGVISAALPKMKHGRLTADIAVLELDEAYAINFVDQVRPRYSLLLNVLRDQLDRFGEIDNTAKLLQYVAEHTTDSVVLNEDDPRLAKLTNDKQIRSAIAWFGADGNAAKYYRNDEELHKQNKAPEKKACDQLAVRLVELDGNQAEYSYKKESASVKLRLFGIHNALNCAAALSVVRQIEGTDFNFGQAVKHLGVIKPAYGRGETITIGETDVRLILVKNPSGFQLSLDSADKTSSLVAINDDYADGRDVSWLWDVSFSKLDHAAVAGARCYDMALRLTYDNVKLDSVEMDLAEAVRTFVDKLKGQQGQIFATYTAMLKIRGELEKLSALEGGYD